MNSSLFIDPSLCRTCGQCCSYFEIWYSKSWDKITLSEMQRFQALARIGDKITIHEVDDGYWLRFNVPCKHLVQDDDGLYSCAIYDNPERPLLCQHFPYDTSTERDCPHLSEGDA
ncbi:MAG: YkgJ family cysteine cluster protein [Desulfomonilia bacterium]|jgi:Fe-S-cluster containining protein|nr:YkgJ family cysteine cluster protein [Desulfomonilia bacterium]